MFTSSCASDLARVLPDLTECLSKHLVMTVWVRHKPLTGLTGLNMAEHQVTVTNVLDDLQSAQCWKMLQKSMNVICEDCKHTIDYVCNIVGLSYGSCQHILSDELNIRWTAAEFVPRLLTGNQK